MLNRLLNSVGRVESRIAKPPLETLAELELKIRAARRRHLPGHYAGDPAWEILLQLDRCAREGRRCHICDLEEGFDTPGTTVLRYLAKLEEDGFVARAVSEDDRRKVEIRLTEQGKTVLQRLFDDALKALDRSERPVVEPLPVMIG